MPFGNYPAMAPFEVHTRAIDLLKHQNGFGDYWRTEFGKNLAFYVRGTTWFSNTVAGEVSAVSGHITAMKTHLKLMRGWDESQVFKWDADFSRVQIGNAWNKKPLTFDKAAQVILTCAVMAEDRRRLEIAENGTSMRPGGDDVLREMNVEPAIYFLHGFTPELYAGLSDSYRHRLIWIFGQGDGRVFEDMTRRETVTFKLADGLRQRLMVDMPDVAIGHVGSVNHKNFVVSAHETIDPKTLPKPEDIPPFGG